MGKVRKETKRSFLQSPAKKAEHMQKPQSQKPQASLEPVQGERLSRGQRVRQRRRQSLKKLSPALKGITKPSAEKRKKSAALASLQALSTSLLTDADPTASSAFLPSDTTQSNMKPHKSLSRHTRAKLVVQEVTHMKKVLEHAAFKAAPLQTLAEHLRNTIAAQNAKTALPSTTTHKRKKDLPS